MEQRTLGRTGREVSVIGLGTWQLGGDWGQVSERDAHAVLEAAVEAGVTFIDTADVYGDGRSEELIGTFLRGNPGTDVTVATKMGRRVPQRPEAYNLPAFREWVDRSRFNLGTDRLDLVQLHCPPSVVHASEEVFDGLETLVQEGSIAAYGVSVETCQEAMGALTHPNLATIQIILNAFRRKPLDQVLPAAADQGVGIIARVPLASGLLSGRYTRETVFAESDHRSFNRRGEAFDVGETFSGVDYETGVQAAAQFSDLAAELGPDGATPAQVALRWVVQQHGVSTVIPGARNADQARANAAAAELPALGDELLEAVARLYDEQLRSQVHNRW